MRLLATTVVRGTGSGEPHGQLLRIDTDAGTAEVLLDWDEVVDTSTRGGDRGLRGVAVHAGRIWVAAADQILGLDPDGTVRLRLRCPALGHAHQVAVLRDHLLIVSTAFDSVLSLDTRRAVFDWGLCIRGTGDDLDATPFDPAAEAPPRGDTVHLNQVHVVGDDVFVSGRRNTALFRLRGGQLDVVRQIPLGTHDVTPTDADGAEVVYNDTDEDRVVWESADGTWMAPVPRLPVEALEGLAGLDGLIARQAFARGLVWLGQGRVAVGSSPGTVSVIDLVRGSIEASVRWTADVRVAVHGLVVEP